MVAAIRLAAICLTPMLLFASVACAAVTDETARIAQLIFHNECAGKESCLTSWNKGEQFASLGIGHFIWYPQGVVEANKHFSESFPTLITYLQARGVNKPDWLQPDSGSPWPDRDSFEKAKSSAKMKELRQLLINTMPLQADFMKQRLDHALPRILQSLPESVRSHLQQQYQRVAIAPMGMYALMDYVNFKGEGINVQERYQGYGWGLLQVLENMQEGESLKAIHAFSDAADRMLSRRVKLSPPARNENRWLPGWRKRLSTYIQQAELDQLTRIKAFGQ